ncbi:hypothetical protein [Promicromonospora sp. NPDC023805]|uniref:MmyB family transcriptional regulator n=1 Tax=Promicromonospora sp. NPDC023805 TaxID=3154696 RepID=UPI003403BDFF
MPARAVAARARLCARRCGVCSTCSPTLVGDLTLDCDTWSSPDGSGQRLMVLTAEAGSPSDEALRILASWTATAGAEAR